MNPYFNNRKPFFFEAESRRLVLGLEGLSAFSSSYYWWRRQDRSAVRVEV